VAVSLRTDLKTLASDLKDEAKIDTDHLGEMAKWCAEQIERILAEHLDPGPIPITECPPKWKDGREVLLLRAQLMTENPDEEVWRWDVGWWHAGWRNSRYEILSDVTHVAALPATPEPAP